MQETSSETDPNKCYYLFYDKGEEAIQWRKDDLSLCGSRRTGCPYAKNKPKKKKKPWKTQDAKFVGLGFSNEVSVLKK